MWDSVKVGDRFEIVKFSSKRVAIFLMRGEEYGEPGAEILIPTKSIDLEEVAREICKFALSCGASEQSLRLGPVERKDEDTFVFKVQKRTAKRKTNK